MENKVTVITGASAGIGAALAILLGKKGHSLILAARTENKLKEVAAKCGSKAITVVTDVRRLTDMERLRDAAIREFGQVDIWVNNAGRGIYRPVMELTDEDIDEIMRVNLKSAFYGMKCIIPHFQERGKGHLINVSSFLGRVPFVTYRSIYNAAKAALNSLTANLRMELHAAYPGIHITLVMPGAVKTDFSRNVLGAPPSPAGLPAGIPTAQTAEEVAETIYAVIEIPKAEIYTNPAQVETVRQYYSDVGAFEERAFQRK